MLLPFQLNLAAVTEVCGSLATESGDGLLTELGEQLGTECFEVCGHLITEIGDRIVTEDGDSVVTECFTPEPTVFLHPGRVYKGKYPYWKPTNVPDFDEDEELMILAAIEMD